MHAGSLSSDRLQRVLAVLREGRSLTTRQIVRKAGVMAASTCIAELRHHGAEIICTQRVEGGKRLFYYTMTKAPN